jgi:DNA/RNA endonuclease YhcR with UshA esterase domain
MKPFFLFIVLLFSITAFSQQQAQPISIDSVQQYLGKYVTIVAKVSGVKETEKISYINLDGAFPNQKLTLVVFTGDRKKFTTSLKRLDGEQVRVTGNITMYKGKPQIKLESEDQIIIVK